jgi:acetylornithine/N-succinyldiaminopimelate aminotransferase
MEEVSEAGFLAEVRRKAGLLSQRLAELADSHPDLVETVRGQGLMLGVKLRERITAGALVEAARDKGLLTVPAADNTVRLLPPLNLADEDIAEGVRRLDAALVAAGRAAA